MQLVSAVLFNHGQSELEVTGQAPYTMITPTQDQKPGITEIQASITKPNIPEVNIGK
jgi:hypothetical protein